MKLMKRSTGSVVVFPRASYPNWASKSLPHLKHAGASISYLQTYAKVIVATPEFVLSDILSNELVLLLNGQEQARTEGDLDEVGYFEMALDRVREREKNVLIQSPLWSAKFTDLTQITRDKKKSPQFERQASTSIPDNFDDFLMPPPMIEQAEDPFSDIPTDEGESSEAMSSEAPSASASFQENVILSTSAPKPGPPLPPSDGMYYFYQAADGQPLFLHPLDVKILKHEYGSYANFPDEICVKVAHMAESILTEDVRSRYKYLAHLPVSCDVAFLEVDWNSQQNKKRKPSEQPLDPLSSPSLFKTDSEPLVSQASISAFSADLKNRIGRHKKKEKKEKREEARRRRDSQSEQGPADINKHSIPQTSPMPTQDPSMMFDFEDEASWQPLGSTSKSIQQPKAQKSSTHTIPSPVGTPTPPELSFAAVLRAREPIALTKEIQQSQEEHKKTRGKKKPVVLLMTTSNRGR